MRTKILLMLSFMGSSFSLLYSQSVLQDVEFVLEDMLLLSERYVTSGADASAYQSTSGWASSAKSLDLFQIDASIHVNTLFIPNNRRSYTITNDELNALRIRGEESASIPTVLGGDTTTFFDFDIGGDPNELQAFEGVDDKQLFHPFLQASVGLWKETDLTVRYSPDIKISDSEYGIFGVGIKHNISQYFRKEDTDSPFEVALQVAYSNFNSDFSFDAFQIDDPDAMAGEAPLLFVDRVDVSADSWLFEALASKQVENFEFFGGIGVIANDVEFMMSGQEGLILGVLNNLLEGLDPSKTIVKGDLGVNYHIGDFYISNAFTFGEFLNYNLSFHYKI